jgi:hypothetical protein
MQRDVFSKSEEILKRLHAPKLCLPRTSPSRSIRKDRRQHLLQLTAAGRRKLVRSLPLWEEAQRQFLSQIGTESLQELRALLTSAESAVTKAFTAHQEKP